MLIKSLTLCNYKNFYGEHSIGFTPNLKNGHNITLIGGINGTGKTTILEAFKICLYGKKFNSNLTSNKNYQKFLVSTKNKKSNRKHDPLFFVKTEIDLNNTFPRYTLELKREWFIENNKIKERFQIYRDSNLLEIIPQEYWQEYILSIVPPYVVDYFCFDGERIKELAIGGNAEKILREAIKDLIGLNLYKVLDSDLTNLVKKIRRRNIKSTGLKQEIEDNEKKIKESKKEVNKIVSKEIKNKATIKELNLKNIKLEENLKRKAGKYAADRKKIRDYISNLKEQLSYIESQVIDICSEVLPFIIASKICKELLVQLNKEKRLKELSASRNILKNMKSNLLKKMKKNEKIRSLDENSTALIKCEIDNMFSEMMDNIKKDQKDKLLHDLDSSESNFIENFLKNSEKNLSEQLKDTLKRREEIFRKIKNENKKINQVPAEEFVDDFIDKITKTRSEIEILQVTNNRLISGKDLLEEKILIIEENINALESEVVCAEKDNITIKLSSSIQKAISEFSNRMIRSKINKLEKLITHMYKKLANKGDMVKEIRINEKNFTAQLFDYYGNVVEKDSISAGEKEIYAISILWGLSKISNKRLPVIIDSPLAKLDSRHRNNIIQEFLPNAAGQVIVLAHDEEINHSSYEKLKPNINSSYTLTLDEKSKIIKGYFPKGKDDK